MKLNPIHQSPAEHNADNAESILNETVKNGGKLDEIKQGVDSLDTSIKDHTDAVSGFTSTISALEGNNKKLEEIKSASLVSNRNLKKIAQKGFPQKVQIDLTGAKLVTIKGDKGEKGDRGDKGITGEKGKDGTNGINGEDGLDGKDGVNGKDGSHGTNGLNGTDGTNGADGSNGKDGSPDSSNEIIEKINEADDKIEPKQIKGLLSVIDEVNKYGTNPTGSGGGSDPLIITSSGTRVSEHVTTLNFSSATYSGDGVVDVTTGGGGTPASPDTSVQFNDGGSFGGTGLFTYDKNTYTLRMGVVDSTSKISGGFDLDSSPTTPAAIKIFGEDATDNDHNGGGMFENSGSGFGAGNGGDYNFGAGSGGDTGQGGNMAFNAGSGGNTSGDGGTINFSSGAAIGTGNGGGWIANAGSGGATSGSGGSFSLTAGSAQGGDSDGGHQLISSGAATGNGNGGYMNIRGGNSTGGSGIGGTIGVDAGDSANQSGGFYNVYGGDDSDNNLPGGVFIGGGPGLANDHDGGDVQIQAGGKNGAGSNGKIKLRRADVNVNAILDPSLISSSDKTFSFPNQTGVFATVTSGSGAPGSTPAAVGQIYVDTTGAKVYISTGTTNSGDWKIMN